MKGYRLILLAALFFAGFNEAASAVPATNLNYLSQTVTTGFSLPIPNWVNFLSLTPTGTLATGTLTMPQGPTDGEVLTISSTQTITSLTQSPSSGQILNNALTTLPANTSATWIFNSGLGTWMYQGATAASIVPPSSSSVILPITSIPDPANATGNIYPNIYSGGGGNASPYDTGIGVIASLGANAVWMLRFPIPPTVPSGTMKLRILALANATTGAAKLTVSDAMVAAGASPSAASLSAETQSTVTWGAGNADQYIETKIPLTAVASGNGMLVAAVTFNTTGFTLAQPSTYIATLIFE